MPSLYVKETPSTKVLSFTIEPAAAPTAPPPTAPAVVPELLPDPTLWPYCADAASGQLDLNNPLIKHDLENPTAPKSAIGYIVEALRLRREKGLKAFTVMSWMHK